MHTVPNWYYDQTYFLILCSATMYTTILQLLYLSLLLLALYTITQYFLHKIVNLPPTPFPILPFIGHIYLLKNPKIPFHQSLSNVARRHGPVVFLWLGSRPVVLVSSPSAAQECFTKNDVVFANRPNLLNGKHFGYNFTSLAWASYGDHWRQLRRIASLELLSSKKIHILSSIRVGTAGAMIRKLIEYNDLNKAIDMKSLLFEYTYNVVTWMIAGHEGIENSKDAEEFQGIVAKMSRVTLEANVVDFLPFVRWFWGFKDVERKMILVQKRRDEFMQNVIDRHRRMGYGDGYGNTKKSFLQILLELQRKEPECYTDETIRNLLLVLVQGASHTSSSTLEWALSRLLENPHILTKARAEIDNYVGKERLITEHDLSKLPYLHCIINETLRMHPAAPLLTPHASSKKCTVSGFNVPQGTLLLVNAWDIHKSSKNWEEPKKFMPERFEGGKNIYGFGFIPFGWGRRACPGENLAMNMVGLALGCLIHCFELEKVGEIDMSEGKGVITPKIQQLSVRCIPRPFVANLVY